MAATMKAAVGREVGRPLLIDDAHPGNRLPDPAGTGGSFLMT
jgi:hypothetical protein